MGLRKTVRKLFFTTQLKLRFTVNYRLENLDADNFANLKILNPTPTQNIKIPKKIWMYWDGEEPKLVKDCIQRISILNPDFELTIINQKNIQQWCDLDFSTFPYLTPQLKSDLIRLHLLYNFGGIWIDASTILYQNLNWIEKLCQDHKTASFAYYRLANTTVLEYPVIESWLLATEKNNVFFKYWLDELKYAIHLGIQYYLKEIQDTHLNYKDFFQNICRPNYLVIYIACQKVMRIIKPSMTLINCDKSAFLYHSFNHQSKNYTNIHFIESMILKHKPKNMPFLIKLVSSDRQILQSYVEAGRIKENSLLDLCILKINN